MKVTPLHSAHINLNAKMAEFAGYDMPIQYETGVLTEHNWTRENAGLFDVSHMGQVIVEGKDAAAFWERLTPSSISKLGEGVAKYSVLTNEEGGIIDDLIITRLSAEKFFAVINAGCKDKDLGWFKQNLPDGVSLTYLEDRALLALQGPKAENVLRDVLKIDASDLGYMRMRIIGDIYVSRLGYTGEDGFEISIPARNAASIWNQFTTHEDVKPIGLAARDSLRLEMGYPLYGHDINAETSPVEADLTWVMGKERKGYIGDAIIARHLADGTGRRRVGIKLTDKGIAREGAEILTTAGEKIGDFTSGGFSPTLSEAIGQGYVKASYSNPGTEVLVRVRGRDIKGVIAALPFVKPKTKAAVKKAA